MRAKLVTARKHKSSTDDQISKMIRVKRTHLDQLQKQNAQVKSTMDVHRRKANDPNPLIFKELQDLYEQTKGLEVKETSELRRNSVYKQLIEYLELEQIRTRKEEDIRYSTLKACEQKLLKKSEHEAEQILIRQNQEIAKINVLREHVEVSRSQRVVYSNLFKKLEKEIRVYEEEFKQLLLETAAIEEKRVEELNTNAVLQTKRKGIEKRTSRIEIERNNNESRMQEMRTETTSKRKEKSKVNQNSNNSYNPSYKSYNSYSSKYSDQRSERRQKEQKEISLEQYERLEVLLETMVVESECQDVGELMGLFGTIEEQNEGMVKQIERVNAEISQYQEEILSGQRQAYRSIEQQDVLETIPLFPTTSEILFDKQSDIKLFRRDLMRIADIFGIQYSDPIQVNEIFSQIQRSVQGFVCVQNLHVSQFFDDESIIPRRQTRRGEDHQNQIQFLIDRAERYHESQKIFEKECFEDEYCKEIIRVRRVTKNKK